MTTDRSSDFEPLIFEEDLDFISDSKTAVLSRSTPFANVTLSLLIVVILTGLLWAGLTEIDQVTRGIGKVVPHSQVQIIQNWEGGILSDVFVVEGDIVQKGGILAQLDKTHFLSKYKEHYAKYVSLLASIARLEAEVQNGSELHFAPEVEEYPALMEQETKLFHFKMQVLHNTLENFQNSYNFAVEELRITKPLVEEGVMSTRELLRIQREVSSIKANMDSYRDTFYEEESAELSEKREEAMILAENLAALQDQVERTTLRSPSEGVVKQIHFYTKGAVVQPGAPIIEVVPLGDALIIEAHIKPADIAFVEAGQIAKVKILAYDYAIYGGLSAEVIYVGADTNVDAQGNSYYEVKLRTEKDYLGSKEGSLPMIPGMTTSVDIITWKKSVLAYLLKPILRAKEKALRER